MLKLIDDMTYFVGFCESHELLNGEWVVGVLVGMHRKRKSSVLLLDISDSCIVGNTHDYVRIKLLQSLNLAHQDGILEPDVPEKCGNNHAEVK